MTEVVPAGVPHSQTSEAPAPVLRFDSVSKAFADGTEAFRDVSFELGPGEFVSIVGPSGCGKTTILKVASGLVTATSGAVTLQEGSLGYVFQDPTLLPWRSVLRNAELLIELQGMPKEERRKRALQALDLVGLAEFTGHLPRQLSGGMRMRASLARSLATSPSVFLFDEPFGSLDEITREHLNEELAGIFVHEGFAALLVTHSIYEAVFLSTRVMVMSSRPGRIVAEFAVPFDHPRTPELRFESAFASLANQVSRALRQGGR